MEAPEWLGMPPGTCFRIVKALYGLPDSGMLFELFVENILFKLDFFRISPGVYKRINYKTGHIDLIGTYVDDFILSSHNLQKLQQELVDAGLKFGKMAFLNDREPIDFNGLTIQLHTREDGTSYITEEMDAYWQRLIDKYKNMIGIKGPSRRVSSPGVKIPDEWHDQRSEMIDQSRQKYTKQGDLSYDPHSISASILYGARANRPDLAFAANLLSRSITVWSKASDSHLHRIMEYIETTSAFKMHYEIFEVPQPSEIGKCFIQTFTDADLGGEAFLSTKSTGGYITQMVGYGAQWVLDWSSKSQPCTATGTPFSEMHAIQRALQQSSLPLSGLYEELTSFLCPVVHLCDNSPVIQVVETGYSSALRYLNRMSRLNIGFMHEFFSSEFNQLHFIRSGENIADILTKFLHGPQHAYLLLALGLHP